jgi:hypothetical protein
VPEREHSPHRQQSSRRPVIVSASELSKRSDVSPLLQQLTSGGELEVTLSTPPTSSSASSDSGVGSSSSHRTSSDAEQTEVTHVSVKPVHARKGQQNAEERPRDATPCRRISYGVEQLSQPHQPEPSSFLLHERIPVHVWNREQPQWQGGKWTHISSFTKLCWEQRAGGALQGAPRCSREPLNNFWLIIWALCYRQRKYPTKRRYTGIKILIHIRPYFDTSCPFLLANTKKKTKKKI